MSTVTINPSLDYVMQIENLRLNHINRSKAEKVYVGGKGINVSIILKRLGIDTTALGFVAGFTGKEIINSLQSQGIQSEFILLKEGMSRMNIKLRSEGETDINGAGPKIEEEHIRELYKKIEKMEEGDFLILAGSVPTTLSSNIYREILHKFKDKKLKVVVDTANELLISVLEYKPFLIKPNHHELGELFQVVIENQEQAIYYAKKLQDKGAKNVLVSMAAKGAVLVTEEGKVITHRGIIGKVKNSVGAGDSMVGGFIAGYLEKQNMEYAFKLGIAAGSATAFSDDLATKEEIFQNLKRIELELKKGS